MWTKWEVYLNKELSEFRTNWGRQNGSESIKIDRYTYT